MNYILDRPWIIRTVIGIVGVTVIAAIYFFAGDLRYYRTGDAKKLEELEKRVERLEKRP